MPETDPDEAIASHLQSCLDAAAEGRAAAIRWGATRLTLVDADRLRTALAALCPSPLEVSRANGAWSVTVRGLPIAATGTDIDTVVEEAISALRAQAPTRLRHTPQHYGEWVLWQLIQLSDDTQLRDWTIGGACVHL